MTAPRRILLATGNPGKLREIIAVLSDALRAMPAQPEWVSLADLVPAIPEPEETGATFAENAQLKAMYYSQRTKLWTLADDSGLEVDALAGEPGVRSARYAGCPVDQSRLGTDAANNRKLIDRLRGVPPAERTARFRCVLVLADSHRVLAESEGAIEGRIIDEPRGSGGFGYDPHFYVDALGRTTAELPPAQKNQISHRGQALRAMARELRTLLLGGTKGVISSENAWRPR